MLTSQHFFLILLQFSTMTVFELKLIKKSKLFEAVEWVKSEKSMNEQSDIRHRTTRRRRRAEPFWLMHCFHFH